jgi:hypothetical protein
MGYIGAREIFSLVWLSIEPIFYIEILLHIIADIQSKRTFGAIVAPQPIYNNYELLAALSDQAAHG